ncbi:variable surface protein Vir18, putative [Plasmodium vivax]|uniref:Variable surface protein Vir18, putative n=1 Tax=Plasmodium vivax (strain Salvador I) TaxID=126793 RepID=A5KD71_PLAVS|nr:variable surface protein Vir18, putative [Plasmodium vivax]EDL42698.1 variable surface protein Vir18, putative [Plasmodium vivax]|eukprot:XP_001612491.1 variable surface protein Vir18 [Plasmodium vivax Sal-1]
MAWPYRGYNRIINTYQQYYAAPCLNSYSTLKSDINEKIDHFYNATHENIYKEWQQLYKYINEKNASIKHCIVNGYIKSDLNEDDKIKNFRSICDNKGNCRINVESNVNTNPPLKRTGRVEPCKGGTNCKTEKVKTKETAGKAKLRSKLDGQSSKAVSLQIPRAQSTSQEHAGGEESNKQSEALPAQSDVMTLPNSIKSEDHEPKSVTNKETSVSVQGRTSTQALPNTGDTPSRELNPQAKDFPSQSSSAGESDEGGTLQVNNPGKSLLQSNLSDDQTLDVNHRNMQTHQVGDVEKQDHKHQIDATERSDRVSSLERASASGKLDNEGSVDGDNNRQDNNVVAHVLEPSSQLYTQNEGVVSASTVVVSSGDASLSPKTYGDGVPGAVNGKEIQNGQERDSEHLCNEISCSAEKDGELTDAKLDILAQISNVIKSNPQIIKTSMPIGIALLLGLLFKYTPLWRVLTKKNRKKGAGINEELNSVLQGPSIMDEETSIPFSYGAFEYSSFDQNSY